MKKFDLISFYIIKADIKKKENKGGNYATYIFYDIMDFFCYANVRG